MLSLISSHTKFSNDAPKPNINVSYSGSYETGEFNGYKYIILKTGSNTPLTLTTIENVLVNYLVCGSGGSGGSGNSGTSSGNVSCSAGNGGNSGNLLIDTLNINGTFTTNVTIGVAVNGVGTSAQGQNGSQGVSGNQSIFINTVLGGSPGSGGIIGSMVVNPGNNGYRKGGIGSNLTIKNGTSQDGQYGYYCPGNGKYYCCGGAAANRLGTWSAGNEQFGFGGDPTNIHYGRSAYASLTGPIKSLAQTPRSNSGSGGAGGISIGTYSNNNWTNYNAYIASGASSAGAVVIWW